MIASKNGHAAIVKLLLGILGKCTYRDSLLLKVLPPTISNKFTLRGQFLMRTSVNFDMVAKGYSN